MVLDIQDNNTKDDNSIENLYANLPEDWGCDVNPQLMSVDGLSFLLKKKEVENFENFAFKNKKTLDILTNEVVLKNNTLRRISPIFVNLVDEIYSKILKNDYNISDLILKAEKSSSIILYGIFKSKSETILDDYESDYLSLLDSYYGHLNEMNSVLK